METWLVDFGANHAYIVYVVIAFVGIAEGPVLSVLMGVLLRLGHFSFLPVYIALMSGDLIGDTVLYMLGYYHGHNLIKKFKKWFKISEEGLSKVETSFHKHKNKILVFSKLTNGMGLGMVVLATAGIVRIPYARFIIINFFGQLVWSGLLLSIGYFFGHVYSQVSSVLSKMLIISLFCIIFYMAYYYSKKLRNNVISE